MTDKVMTAEEAIRRFVHDGDTVYSGFATVPFGLCFEVMRQRKQHLELVGGSLNHQASLLLLAGCADRVRTGYLAAALRPGIVQRRMAAGDLRVTDYSNGSIALMLMAGALGMPFIATRSFLGTDYLEPGGDRPSLLPEGAAVAAADAPPKWSLTESPFTGERTLLLPALRPDVTLLHAQRADRDGNIQTWGHQGDARWAYWAAKRVIVSVEEIVDSEVIRSDPGRTVVPGFRVDAVVEMPHGAHPSGLAGYYESDYAFLAQPIDILGVDEDYDAFAEKWVYGVKDQGEYIERYRATFGNEALARLKADDGRTPVAAVPYTHGEELFPEFGP